MRRREFITFLGGATTSLLTAGAGQSAARRLGILFATSEKGANAQGQLDAVVEGLKEHNWIEGRNYTFEYRFADNKADLLPKLATEIVESRPDAILTDGTPATLAAKSVSGTTPIVAVSNDPLGSGFIASFSRPGGNITGIGLESGELAGRRLQLLTEIVPGLGRVSVLSNPLNPSHALLLKQLRTSAQKLAVAIHVAEVPTPERLDDAFLTITAAHSGAVIVLPDATLFAQYPRVVAFADETRLPTLFPEKRVVQAGGLIAYGANITAVFRQTAAYVDKIFRGANPADLPVETPTVFELTINIKAAKALGLHIPDKLIATADEVVE
jgi:putative tryptophan/tyrosine transport system substrate-binding protein